MSNLTTMPNYKPYGEIEVVINHQGEPLVDSRSIAAKLGRDHHDWFNTVLKRYEKQSLAALGQLCFQTTTVKNRVGAVNTVRYALLTEDQCYFFVMSSRNTPNVIQAKLQIVKRFSEARKRIAELEQQQLNPKSEQLQITATSNTKLIINPETLEPVYGQNLESQVVNRIAVKAGKATKLSELRELLMIGE